MSKAGLPFIVTCTARSVREQVALYAQGREPLEHVNTLRRLARLGPISYRTTSAGSPGPCNPGTSWTWTTHPENDKARAFDIALLAHRRQAVRPLVHQDGRQR
jgi:hypothetical protein